jgi:hypothetical protein
MTTSRYRGWLRTLEAAALLGIARILVAVVRMGRWSTSLGTRNLADPASPALLSQIEGKLARKLARKVGRAAVLLPGRSKCLPQAMALQWMLRRRQIPSRMVIAAQLPPFQAGEDRFHAWIELGNAAEGEMILGACDRARYTPIMAFQQPASAVLPDPQGAVPDG